MLGSVTASRLNVRARPNINSRILGTLKQGTVVDVQSKRAGWFEIQYQDQPAFVASSYIEPHHTPARGRVTARLLNVRTEPGTEAAIIGQLTKGTDVTIDNTLGDWHKIPFGGGHGFVFSQYVQMLEASDTDSETPIADNRSPSDDHGSDTDIAAQVEEGGDPLVPARLLPETGSSEERNVSRTWNRYGALLERLCEQKQLETACAVAVICVESSGEGFNAGNQGRMVIRFENHKFWSYWGKQNPDIFRRHFKYRSDRVWLGHKWRRAEGQSWQTFHGNQSTEWEVLDFARNLANDAALQSISMGAPQIMGFHYQRLGYHSAQEMFDDFCSGIEAQLRGLFDFLSPTMVQRLQSHDFVGFAALYNGTGQKEKYGTWIEQHYQAFKRIF